MTGYLKTWRFDVTKLEEVQTSTRLNTIALLVAFIAGVVVFLPFAFDTSPWDAIILRVPGDQGNWWHALVGAPFFLAFPMILLRLRSFFSKQLSTAKERRIIWVVVGLSICATISVETPFLLHLAGTSEWQRLVVLCLGLGIVITSAAFLLIRRRYISPLHACLIGLNTAYLANAALCLVVYAGATGTTFSKSGWMVTLGIVWPMLLEVCWIFIQTFKKQSHQSISPTI